MGLQTPDYQIRTFRGNRFDKFNRDNLRDILAALPLLVEVAEGHDLLLRPRRDVANGDSTLMVDYHGAQVISLRPPTGRRLADACMAGRLASEFTPSRIMDEVTGGGACCSYRTNTQRLGLPFAVDFCLDIYKLG